MVLGSGNSAEQSLSMMQRAIERTWEPTRVLTDLPAWEGLIFDPPYRESGLGYPSTVQLADGSFVTAWYSIGTEQHTRYHMGTVLWKLD